jgi:hypothetical protein
VGAQQIVPAIAVEQRGGFHVDRDIDRLVAGQALGGLGIKLDHADRAEIGAVAQPQVPFGQQERRIDGVVQFHPVAGGDRADVVEAEILRGRIERLRPHDPDVALVPAVHAAAAHGPGDEIAVAQLDDVGRDAAAGAHRAALPGPAVAGDEPAAERAERVELAIRFHDGRGSWI